MNRLRERRRLDTVRAIKKVAIRQLDAGGPAGLTLRGIAREIGVAVQSLYHYFDDRNALLDALVDDGFHELGLAVTAAVAASRGELRDRRRTIVVHAVREWAHANCAHFLLLSSRPQPMRPADYRSHLVPIVTALAEIESVDLSSAADIDKTAAESYCRIHGVVLMELLGYATVRSSLDHPLPSRPSPNCGSTPIRM
jgi:AcrR family transcriptional regulator